MKKREELYHLIRSLDPHELRYFRLFAKRHVTGKENAYLKLFDVILENEQVNDAQLRTVHKIKNLPRAKQYLLLLVHKALLHYHDNESGTAQVKRYTRLAEILLEKGEFPSALLNLDRAEKAAKKFFFQAELLRIAGLRYQVRSRSGDPRLMTDYPKLSMQEFQLLEESRTITAARLLLEEVKKIDKDKGSVQGRADDAEYKKVYRKIAAALKHCSGNAEAELLLRNALLFYYYNHSRHEDFYREVKRMLAIYDQKPGLVQKDEFRYLVTLNNYLVCCVRTGRKKEFQRNAELFRSFRTNSRSLQEYIYLRFANLSVYRLIQYNEFSGITQLLPLLNETLSKVSHRNAAVLGSVYYSACICLLQVGHFREALKWSNKIIAGREFLHNNSVFRPAMIINLIAAWELSETQLLLSNLGSFQRMISKQKMQEKYESIFFSAMKKICSVNSAQKKSALFSELKDALEHELHRNSQSNVIYGYDVVKWAAAHSGSKS